jgi:hypothetical protein
MAILGGIVLMIVILFLWLSAHWFGRVLAFIVFSLVIGLLLGGLLPPPKGEVYNWGGLIFGVFLAWPVSGIPRYYQRLVERNRSRQSLAVRPG